MFCSKCGAKTINRDIPNEGNIPYCSTCDILYFPKSNMASLLVLENAKGEILLLKQKVVNEFYVLIAGYNKPGESMEETIIRETKEETGISVKQLKYIGSYYYSKKDTQMIAYSAKCDDVLFELDKSEVDDAIWIKKDKSLKLLRKNSIGYKVLMRYIKCESISGIGQL